MYRSVLYALEENVNTQNTNDHKNIVEEKIGFHLMTLPLAYFNK